MKIKYNLKGTIKKRNEYTKKRKEKIIFINYWFVSNNNLVFFK